MPTATAARVETEFDDWWTVGEVARAISLSTQRVQYYSRIGKFRYVQTRFGKVFDPKSVEQFAIEYGKAFVPQIPTPPRQHQDDE